MEPSAAVRAHDLPIFGGVVLSLVLLGGLVAVYRLLFYSVEPKLGLLRILQERLRPSLAVVVGLVPTLNFFYWVPNLFGFFDEVYLALCLALLVVGIEAVLACLFDYVLARLAFPIPESVTTAARLVIYAGVGLYFVGMVMAESIVESDALYAGLWILLVFSMLHMVYRYLFRTASWRHPLARTLRDRLRLWVYLLILLLTLAYATTWLVDFPLAYEVALQQALVGLVVILVLETILAIVFEFYFPAVRRITVPNLFRDLTRGLVYLVLVLLALGVVFKQDLSSLVVGSTVLSVILGLALQETLGNFFAGLALGVSKPYNLGDFVEVHGLGGMVEKIDWRSTALRTTTGDYTVLPNSVLAKETIINFSAPSTLHARLINLGAHYRHPPNEVRRAILEAAASVAEVLPEPAPEVWLMEFADSSMNYRLRYWMRDYGRRFEIDSRVREAIWYHFSRRGIEIPFPIRNVIHNRPAGSKDLEKEVRALLDQVDFLKALAPEELQILVDRTRLHLYAQGERVFSQGEPGDTFYLIKDGRLRVTARSAQGEIFLSKDMHSGEFFGEMALLTGEPRSATVEAVTDAEVLTLDKGALRELLRTNPDVDRLISEVLARRQLRTVQAREELESEKARTSAEQQGASAAQVFEQLSEQFLKRIREFFSY